MMNGMHIGKDKLTLITVSAVLVVSLGASVYFYLGWQKEKQKSLDPTTRAQQEAKDLVARVSKLMELPSGEEPTVARITDPTKLASQAFFAKAKKGDQVIIYTNAKLAILYDPEVNRILNVAPVNIGAQATESAQTQTQVRFVLLNGTSKTGLTRSYEGTIASKVPGAQIVDRDNAKKNDYKTSLLVDLSGNKGAQAAELARTLGLTSGTLPQGEDAPQGADFLIILGQDQEQ